MVIPVFNERETLQPCLERVVAVDLPDGWTSRVVIVDDHSERPAYEAARAIIEQLNARGHDLVLERHGRNLGKGAALQTGFDIILNGEPADDDVVIIQDADVEYDPDDYPKLLEPLLAGTADAVIGTRWGEHRPADGFKRRVHEWGNRVLTMLSNMMTGYRVQDMECCYKLMPIGLLRRVRPMLTEPRFGIEPQIVAALARLKVDVAEVPVSYEPRGLSSGKKIGWRDGVRALYVIARERLRRLPDASRGSNPQPSQS